MPDLTGEIALIINAHKDDWQDGERLTMPVEIDDGEFHYLAVLRIERYPLELHRRMIEGGLVEVSGKS